MPLNRWSILVLLFLVRCAIGYQFQSVATVSPWLMAGLMIDYALLGTLMGLYMLPGILFALPGGILGHRFGDTRIVLVGLLLMALGGFVTGIAETFVIAAVGRLVSGLGAVLLNVLLSKMATDWFAGYELPTAMGALLSAFPLGIGLALLTQGPLAENTGWTSVMHLTAATSVLGMALMAILYSPPSTAAVPNGERAGLRSAPRQLRLVMIAGVIWAFYNAGFVILLGFAPDYLAGTGMTAATAGYIASITSWIIIPALPLGGRLSESLRHTDPLLVLSMAAAGTAACLIPSFEPMNTWLMFAVIGLCLGPPGALIVSLPAEVLSSENRAEGMGIFYTFIYVGMAVFTPLAGLCRDLTDVAGAPLLFSGAMLLAPIPLLGLFRHMQRRYNFDYA